MCSVRVLPQAHQDVFGLDVAVDDSLLVQVLESCDELMEEHQGGLQRKLAATVFHKVFDCGPEKLCHDVVAI